MAAYENNGGPNKRRWRVGSRGRRPNHGARVCASDLVATTLQRVVPDERLTLARVQLAWSRAIPVRVQRVAWPAAITRDNLLVLHVVDNQWLHELSYLRFDVLTQMRRACEGITIADLRMRVGDVQMLPAAEAPPPPAKPPLPAEPPRSTIDALESIEDPELRQAMANARLALGRL